MPQTTCPICNHTSGCKEMSPGFWCCLRTPNAAPGWIYCGEAKSGMGGLHRHPDAPSAPPGPPPKRPKFDLATYFKRFFSFLKDPGPWDWVPGGEPPPEPPPPEADLTAHAECLASFARREGVLEHYARGLHLPVRALIKLGCGVHPGTRKAKRGKGLAFPEKDGTGRVIGIAYRSYTGSKFFENNTHRGLTYPDDWDAPAGPVVSPEGGSCTLAGVALGLATVGRPSNTGGVEHLAELWARVPSERPIVIIGENDRKADGRWAGRDGTLPGVKKLSALMGRPVWFCLPPPGFKDLRDWVVSLRLNFDDPAQVEMMKEAFLDYLEKEHIVVEVSAEEREEATRQEEARKAQAEYLRCRAEARLRVQPELEEARLAIPNLAKLVDELTFEPVEPEPTWDDPHAFDDICGGTEAEVAAARARREAEEQARLEREAAEWHARQARMEEARKRDLERYGSSEPAGPRRGACGKHRGYGLHRARGGKNLDATTVYRSMACACWECRHCRTALAHDSKVDIDTVFKALPPDVRFVALEDVPAWKLKGFRGQRVVLRIKFRMNDYRHKDKVNLMLAVHESYLAKLEIDPANTLDKEAAYWRCSKWIDALPMRKRPISRSSLLFKTNQPHVRVSHQEWTEKGLLGGCDKVYVVEFPLSRWGRILKGLELRQATGYAAYILPGARVRMFTVLGNPVGWDQRVMTSDEARTLMEETAREILPGTEGPVWVSETWWPKEQEVPGQGQGERDDDEDIITTYVPLPNASMSPDDLRAAQVALGASVEVEETGQWRTPTRITAVYDGISIQMLSNLGKWLAIGHAPTLDELCIDPAAATAALDAGPDPPDEPFSAI